VDCHQAVPSDQAARRAEGGRPEGPQRHLLDIAVGSAMARSAGELWALHACYNRFVRWRMAGIWDSIMEALAETHDSSVQMIDTSIVRVHQHGGCAGGAETRLMGRSRGGLTTKIHACVDTNGMPVRLELTTGEAHDNPLVTELLSDLQSGAMLLADRGYDADLIRAFAGDRGAWANIPPKRNRKDPICFSPCLYRARNLVERFFNRIKQCRRIATRYDKLAANYLAFIKLAAIRIWLRAYESTP